MPALPVTSAKATAVRDMFSGIAPSYDRLNHLLSFNLDRLWRRAAVRAVRPGPGERALDACAGTLDLAILLARTGARVVAFDFCREMLVRGRRKASSGGYAVPLVEADALCPPFAPESFDVVTVAFGVRNLSDPARGLCLLASLLKPGGRIAILEFARPTNPLFRSIYYAYFHHLLPVIGRMLSRHSDAYSYLPESVMTFLEPRQMMAILREAGLERVQGRALGLGAVTLVTASRPI